MKVLLVEGVASEAREAEAVLLAAGHDVTRCVEEDAAAFPCNGMIDGHCPVEDETIDAAVLVRGDLGDSRTGREDGVRCALRHHIPLVLSGDAENSPYAAWATDATADVDGLPDALERASSALLDRHTAAAERSMRAVLITHDLDTADSSAEVHRDGNRLRVVLRPGHELTPRQAETVGVRVAGAIRDIDPYAATIDVAVD